MKASLDGKRILVTQAEAFMGPALVEALAARGAQLAYVQAVGIEIAPHNVPIKAIAQNFVDNPTGSPAAVQADPRFQERLKREVPLGRLIAAPEDAAFAACLCSEAANGSPAHRGFGRSCRSSHA